ncbi:glycosyltransferase family 4 protein [Dissulfurirhabdus thermomarina]|uniref:Glycosyltransferase family 4 protein n=1 Tax=Dissulfurirhabdus thermomarina TaxID=1765737 RepID=A0A6N9TR10_DISTH|nr:glycosyltransferase family 4 protein [Dissulfurirhabdus thermomarina]NDY41877.1 glycosyltransferase family 4 protein [Dissulfurirhabdus thermomarina]NMX22578.1 glycosyltransferase family 4 protein [Dissulfurirhabdus thermomarina]
MKILALTRYSSLGASSRVRSYQFFEYFQEHGVDVRCCPFFDAAYLANLYGAGRRDWGNLWRAYSRRIGASWGQRRKEIDLLWIEKEVLPWLPAPVERFLWLSRFPYVVDYDDAVFHNYDLHPSGFVRRLLGRKIDSIMAGAELVTAGNAYLGERARRAGAKRVEIVPSVVDTEKFRPKFVPGGEVFTIGWIGTPFTARYLDLVAGSLAEVCKGRGRVVLVGAGAVSLPGVPVEVRPWSEDTEVAEIQSFDVGIMPLPDGPWERGKCGYKLIQYMACGKPVVASPVGANREIVRDGETGFLADGRDGWISALQALMNDPGKRIRMGRSARERVVAHYSRHVVAPRLLQLLEQAAGAAVG